jgi:hypothetical protein
MAKSVSQKIEALVSRAATLDEQIAALTSERAGLAKKLSVIETLFDASPAKRGPGRPKKITAPAAPAKRGPKPKAPKSEPTEKRSAGRPLDPHSLRGFIVTILQKHPKGMSVPQLAEAVRKAGYEKCHSESFSKQISVTLSKIGASRPSRGVYCLDGEPPVKRGRGRPRKVVEAVPAAPAVVPVAPTPVPAPVETQTEPVSVPVTQ